MKTRTLPLTKTPCLLRSVLDCGGKSDVTPLWNRTTSSDRPTLLAAQKRRRRCASAARQSAPARRRLPAQSKMWRRLVAVSVLALLSTLNPQLSTCVAQGTAFTYQGRLQHTGSPANGLYEMSYALYDAVSNGNAVGTPLTVAPVLVSNGLFTATLDFGAGAFMGASRWLEISVTVFGSDQPVVTLVPRQPITPAPNALHAANAAGLMSFNNAPLDIKVNGQRALRLEPNPEGAPNVIGGAAANQVAPGTVGATIGGGGAMSLSGIPYTNRIAANFGTIGGGLQHTIQDGAVDSTIGGGERNTIQRDADLSTIGGGFDNTVRSYAARSTIGGGVHNTVHDGATYSTIGGGQQNVAAANHSTVSGGHRNSAGDEFATVGGGGLNRATGFAAVVAGGGGTTFDDGDPDYGNSASGLWSAVLGGANNVAAGPFSTVGGGASNVIQAEVERSVIGGGTENRIGSPANAVTIAGGTRNSIAGPTGGSTIGGGWENTIQEEASLTTIGGGGNNYISDNAGEATISGGWQNSIGASSAAIAGGAQNVVIFPGHYAAIGGGLSNRVSNYAATVSGGGRNQASGFLAVVAGGGGVPYEDGSRGEGNIASGDWSGVLGGAGNTANGPYATVAGGLGNTASNNSATVGGGAGNAASGDSAVVAGGSQNRASGNSATIGGGFQNAASGLLGTLGGGAENTIEAGSYASTIGGGGFNIAGASFATVGGGNGNRAIDHYVTVGGGVGNNATGNWAVVGGGFQNTASGHNATVPGGYRNEATTGAFAAGWQAKDLHPGAFVWAGASSGFFGENPNFVSIATNEFAVRATGGARFVTAIDTNGSNIAGVTLAPGSGTWSSLSDRNAKENFTPANPREILDKVAALPVASWNYKAQGAGVRHLGPTAQDFHAAFGLGESDRAIPTVDADGVALAAIQGLNQKLTEELKRRDAENAELKQRLERLERRIANVNSEGTQP